MPPDRSAPPHPKPDAAGLTLRDVVVAYGPRRAVDGVSLTVPAGSFTALVGPSGCGKTSLLRAVAGFEPVHSGEMHLDAVSLRGVPPERRPTAMVFQSYALFPHLDVGQNVAFGLQARGLPKAEIGTRVREALGRVQLADRIDTPVTSLSGGQQQRVALARALVVRPRLILFDEPLSNLDAALREATRTDLRRLHDELGTTALYVTHDQAEALSMADQVAVLRAGRVEQIGPPMAVYRQPETLFVASFVGRMNLLPATVVAPDAVQLANGVALSAALASGQPMGRPVTVAIHPEHVQLSTPADGQVVGTVESVQFLGATVEITVRLDSGERMRVIRLGAEARPAPGEAVGLGMAAEHRVVLTDRLE